MRNNINSANIEGRLYEMKLTERTVQNTASINYGKPFISGYIAVATDEEGLNVLTVHYDYITPTFKSGKENKTYTTLSTLLKEGVTWLKGGKDAATLVKCTPSLRLRDWWSASANKMCSTLQNAMGLLKIVSSLNPEEKYRNTFMVDMFISSIRFQEADEEKQELERLLLRGAIFDFKNSVMPVTFSVTDKAGIEFFENYGVEPSNPLYIKCVGVILNKTIKKQTKEEAAFGEIIVKETSKKEKDYIVTMVPKIPYDFGDEKVLTMEDLRKAQQDREVYLASIQKKAEEDAAKKAADRTAVNSPLLAFGASGVPLF